WRRPRGSARRAPAWRAGWRRTTARPIRAPAAIAAEAARHSRRAGKACPPLLASLLMVGTLRFSPRLSLPRRQAWSFSRSRLSVQRTEAGGRSEAIAGREIGGGDSRRLTPFQRAGVENGFDRRTAARLQRRDGVPGPAVGRLEDLGVTIDIRQVDSVRQRRPHHRVERPDRPR